MQLRFEFRSGLKIASTFFLFFLFPLFKKRAQPQILHAGVGQLVKPGHAGIQGRRRQFSFAGTLLAISARRLRFRCVANSVLLARQRALPPDGASVSHVFEDSKRTKCASVPLTRFRPQRDRSQTWEAELLTPIPSAMP